ncbi:hypothetical protein E4U54_005808 [Claviceps lovelessii]|nr:hypothetical protein E4U54_005808 [Claviceps lovelessii]
MKLLVILLVGSMAFASPQPDRDVEVVDQDQAIRPCRKRCISFINECGVHYSGCYKPCKERPPIPPPCSPITTPVQLPTGGLPTPTSKDNCSTRTVCVDYVNECGMWYGGCIPDCKPWKSFAKPPCPTTTSTTATAYPTAL